MYGNAMEKFVNVIAGKPGAGKTLYVQKEIEDVKARYQKYKELAK